MLLLAFRIDTARYAVDARQVIEILPLIRLHPSTDAPQGIAGNVNYRGTPLPVVDVTQLLTGRPAAERLSTRIAVMRYPLDGRHTRPLGLILEQATETLVRAPSDFVPCGISNAATPYLGPIAPEPDGLLQLIELGALLPAAVRDALFSSSAAK